jgi:hypothetical protein
MSLIYISDVVLELEGGGELELEGTGSLSLESSPGDGAIDVYDLLPTYPIPLYHWQHSPFFQMEPGDQVNPAYLEAWQNPSTQLMPLVRTEELHGEAHQYPSCFGGTIEPSNYISPPESWLNQSTWLMPEVYPRDLEGLYAAGMTGGAWEVMQLSTPIFPPDGTRVASPTSTKPGFKGVGRTQTTRRPA